MAADPAPNNASVASWLSGSLLVLVQKNTLSALRRPGIALHAFAFEGVSWRISLVCAHERAERAGLEKTFREALCSWQTLVRERFAPLDPVSRAEICSFLAAALSRPCCGAAGGLRLAAELHAAREGLRERLPCDAPAPALALRVDALVAVDERSYYVRGSLACEGGLAALTAVSPEGARVNLRDGLFRFAHGAKAAPGRLAAEEKTGFIRYFELPSPSLLADGWVFELRGVAGEEIEVAAPAPIRDPIRARDSILGDLALENPRHDELMAWHLQPALRILQARHHDVIAAVRVEQFGAAPAQPAITVLVPLYQRIDFLEHQLAQFTHDPAFREGVDLIYVLDSPEQGDALAALAARLAPLYGVPFRLVTLNRNGGYSAANNVGAALARGELLVLLNSDVLPSRPGWLAQMAAFYRATPKLGALGPKLLFEDNTLQHAGLYFSAMPDNSGWENLHYFKGLHGSFPAANIARPVPALTGACLMLERALYERLGGLRGLYVQGDYEDSDLCLRLAAEGLESWYLPAVELFHLEGQSYPGPLRQLTSRYNRWLHAHEQGAQIELAQQRHSHLPTPR